MEEDNIQEKLNLMKAMMIPRTTSHYDNHDGVDEDDDNDDANNDVNNDNHNNTGLEIANNTRLNFFPLRLKYENKSQICDCRITIMIN